MFGHVLNRLRYWRCSLTQSLIRGQRQSKSARGCRRRTLAKGSPVPEATHLVHGTDNVAERRFPGHREGDFIRGACNRLTVGTRQMQKPLAFLRQTPICDRGSDMAHHAALAEHLKIDIRVADPCVPWRRRNNENIHGLLRQFLRKGTAPPAATQAVPNDIARLVNGSPHGALDWRMPAQS